MNCELLGFCLQCQRFEVSGAAMVSMAEAHARSLHFGDSKPDMKICQRYHASRRLASFGTRLDARRLLPRMFDSDGPKVCSRRAVEGMHPVSHHRPSRGHPRAAHLCLG